MTNLYVYIYEGTPLGDKTMEVAQKVATDTAEELKKSAAALDREVPGKQREHLNVYLNNNIISKA